MQAETIWPGLSLPASQVRAGLPTTELAQKAACVEADGVHVHLCAYTAMCACACVCACVCMSLLREAALLGWMWLLSVHLRVLPFAQSEERVSLSLFLKFLRLEIMYFSWPRMKARE